jgi:hypothetical protein
MSVSKRRCATCRYFQDAGMSGNGWCTHPKRQLSSDVRILVRRGELACRDSWGVDLWEGPSADDAVVANPEAATLPAGTAASITASYDDEVTSVVSTDSTQTPTDDQSDRVVEQTTLLPDDDSYSTRGTSSRPYRSSDQSNLGDPDQEDRVEIMARGNRQALLRAQERHRLRRGQPSLPQAPASAGTVQETDATATSRRVEFAPDDYVEDESPSTTRPAPEAPGEEDDVLLVQGAIPSSIRARRLRRSRNHSPARDFDAVPKSEMSPDTGHLTSRLSEDSRFDTVPEIRSDVDLPRLRRHVPESQDTPSGTPDTSQTNDPPDPVNPFDEVIKQAQAIKAAARAEREARQMQERRASMLPITSTFEEPAAERPVMPEIADALAETPDAAWMEDPEASDEAVPAESTASVDTEWLASRGIRFQRHRPVEDSELDAIDEPEDDVANEFDEFLPEPTAGKAGGGGCFLVGSPSATPMMQRRIRTMPIPPMAMMTATRMNLSSPLNLAAGTTIPSGQPTTRIRSMTDMSRSPTRLP